MGNHPPGLRRAGDTTVARGSLDTDRFLLLDAMSLCWCWIQLKTQRGPVFINIPFRGEAQMVWLSCSRCVLTGAGMKGQRGSWNAAGVWLLSRLWGDFTGVQTVSSHCVGWKDNTVTLISPPQLLWGNTESPCLHAWPKWEFISVCMHRHVSSQPIVFHQLETTWNPAIVKQCINWGNKKKPFFLSQVWQICALLDIFTFFCLGLLLLVFLFLQYRKVNFYILKFVNFFLLWLSDLVSCSGGSSPFQVYTDNSSVFSSGTFMVLNLWGTW